MSMSNSSATQKASTPSTILLALIVIVSGGALAIAVVAYRAATAKLPSIDPSTGKKYDFSSPEAAYKSHTTMYRDGDIAAIRWYEVEFRRALLDEKLKTFEVSRVAEYSGKRVLFVKYQSRGMDRYDTVAMERDAASGLWGEVRLSYFDVTDEKLKDEMRKWEDQTRP